DALMPMTLLAMARVVAALGEERWLEDAHLAHGIPLDHLSVLHGLIGGDLRWKASAVASMAQELEGVHLATLERLFVATEKAISKAQGDESRAISRFTLQLQGPCPPFGGLTAEGKSGLDVLLKL